MTLNLYHYFDQTIGPFRNLSDVADDEAACLLAQVAATKPNSFCAKQRYTYDEILMLINQYGLPQEWNADGSYGPERYIEAHIWCDEPLKPYL